MNLVNFKRHVVHAVGDIVLQLHGLYVQSLLVLKDGVKVLTGDAELRTLPVPNVGDAARFESWLDQYRALVEKAQKAGYHLLPPKVRGTKPMVLLFVHKDRTKIGQQLEKLKKSNFAAFKALYQNGVAIGDYSNQPFDRMLKGVPVARITEESVEVKLSDFKEVLKKKGIDFKNFAKGLLEKVMAPFGDGQIYVHPESPILGTLPPEEVKGLGRKHITAVKVIGVWPDKPFVFIKGVITVLSLEEWREKCRMAGVPEDFRGMIVNQHALKNKLKLRLPDGILSFNIGYHSDDRSFGFKVQTAGSQLVSRSVNLTSSRGYWKAVVSLLETAVRAGKESLADLVKCFIGVSKVKEGAAHYGNILRLLALGTPLSFFEKMNKDGGVAATFNNMLIKRSGQQRIDYSIRCYPCCKTHLYEADGSKTLGINQVGLTSAQARAMRVREGDKIVINRSPKGTGFPTLVLKVISIREASFSLNPVLYTLWAQGDFDGDSIAVYPNTGKMHHNTGIVEILKVLFEKEDDDFVRDLEEIKMSAWKETPYRHLLESLADDYLVGPVAQALVAKYNTGSYDNLASRMRMAGLSAKHLRTFWNKVTQLCITNMKHVGSMIPDGLSLTIELGKKFKLGVLQDIHAFMAGKRERFQEMRDHTDGLGQYDRRSRNSIARGIIGLYEQFGIAELQKKEVKYADAFRKEAAKFFRDGVALLKGKHKEVFNQLFHDATGSGLVKFNETLNPLLNGETLDKKRVALPNCNARFAAIQRELERITKNNEELLDFCWVLLIVVSLFEPFKQWLLTRKLPEGADKRIGIAVHTIAQRASKSIGYTDRLDAVDPADCA